MLKDRFTYHSADALGEYHQQTQERKKVTEKKLKADCQRMSAVLAQIENDNKPDAEPEREDLPLTFTK